MIAPDTNLLVYSVNRRSPFHDVAKEWLERKLSGPEIVGFAWNVLLGFIRVTTHPASRQNPLAVWQALDLVSEWLSLPTVTILEPGFRHFQILSRLLTQVGTAGNLTSDAHLAALAIEHGAEVYSNDNDFARFPGLAWRNPLAVH